MARTLDRAKRAQLLADVVNYIDEHGLVDLSLRPLAAALGTSSRMLIYYFGTKEELLIQALGTVPRPDLPALFAGVTDATVLRERLTILWSSMSVGEASTSTRILLQFMTVAGVTRGPYAPIVEQAIERMITTIAAAMTTYDGGDEHVSRTRATAVIAGLRGVLLDRMVTGDVERTESAAHAVIDAATGVPAAPDGHRPARRDGRTVRGDDQP